MADSAIQDSLAGDPLAISRNPMSSEAPEPPMVGVKRVRSTDSEDEPRQRPRHDTQMINTLGVSGNSRVLNVGGNYIAQMNNGLGAETHAVLESIEQHLKGGDDAGLSDKVKIWLSGPDISQNFNGALRRRQLGTGNWFLDGAEFAEWKEKPNLLLCLYGAPGCGKTVLCSSIIEAVKASCTTQLSGWAYFFFDGRSGNRSLRLYETFLLSVLSQLCSRCGSIPEAVKTIYHSHGNGSEKPCVKVLEETLREIIGAFDDVYIMVDSVDESEDRTELVSWIQHMAKYHSAKWHILVTSRPEPDITSPLDRINNIRKIYLQGAGLDKDISFVLDERLSLVNRWSGPIRALIKTTLMGGADGMFRWVVMQIDSLQTCMNTKEVKEKLKALPKDLEETYEDILTRSTRRHDLLHMLHWLAFSTRALRLEELAEVPSVDFEAANGPCYDPDLKYANSRIALTVCSGLIAETDGVVKLAHFSVKEYLISESIKSGTAAPFAINQRLSHSAIAQTCAAYLLIFNQSDSLDLPGGTSEHFPLHLYAAENLADHLGLTENTECPALRQLLFKLFIPPTLSVSALANWVEMYDFDEDNDLETVAPPLYYASFLGLQDVVGRLLENGADVNLCGGWFETALGAAAAKGHAEIAKLLLKRGADANAEDECFFRPLSLAAESGRIELVKLLLEHSVDVNFPGGESETALHAAAREGHTETIKLLLEHGADVDLQAGWSDETALWAAAWRGHTDAAKLLLEHGADINGNGVEHGTALETAAGSGHIETTKLLLEHGADVDSKAVGNETALQAASRGGHAEIAKLLLEHGAHVNSQGGTYGTALQVAAGCGYTEIAKLLFEHGADVNIQAGTYGTALHAAAAKGRIEIVKFLLDRGADVNIQTQTMVFKGGYRKPVMTAFEVAAAQGETETAQLLFQYSIPWRN